MVEILAEHRPVRAGVGSRTAVSARPAWEARYVWQLIGLDVITVGGAHALAFWTRSFQDPNKIHVQYLWMSVLLSVGWMLALSLNRCYDTRHLFVGTEEYQRIFRAALALMATVAITLYAFDLGFAREYMLAAFAIAFTAVSGARFVLRRGLHAGWEQGYRLRRVIAVGHGGDVANLCSMLRRSRYHGLEVVGACLPDPAMGSESVPVPVYGSFESVNAAAARAGADTVIVLTCPELNGPALRRRVERRG